MRKIDIPIYEPQNINLYSLPEKIQQEIFKRDEIGGCAKMVNCYVCGDLRKITQTGLVLKCLQCGDKRYNVWSNL